MTKDTNEEHIRQLEADAANYLIDLTANLMRVTRGAGSPYFIYSQAYELLQALQEHRTANNNTGLPSHFYTNALNFKTKFDQASDSSMTLEGIANGSLRFVAAKLLGQDLQKAHGKQEMLENAARWVNQRREV